MPKYLLMVPIFASCTFLLYLLSLVAPSINENQEHSSLIFPTDTASLKSLSQTLNLYAAKNWWYVFILFSCAYLYKQAFSIPGSGVLNVLAGALYGPIGGLIFVCVYTAIGASVAFLISQHFYKEIVDNYFYSHFEKIQKTLEKNRHNLFYYMLSIRLVPVSPGWAINLISPLLNVPLNIFIVTTFLGLIPYNFLGVSAGEMIATLNSINEIFTWRTFSLLIFMATAALGPTLIFKLKSPTNPRLN